MYTKSRNPSGLNTIVCKLKKRFKIRENINYYSDEKYRQAERKFVTLCLKGVIPQI
jgi:hypothetical protein